MMTDSGVNAHFVPVDYFRRWTVEEIFPDHGERLEIDLGAGDGGFLLQMGEHFPQTRFLGIERLMNRVRKIANGAKRRGLANVKILRLELDYAVRYALPQGAVDRVHLLCPDPWPKKKHSKNRLVQPDFVAGVHRLLKDDGEWLFKTDHAEYYEEAMGTILGTGLFQTIDWPEEAFFYPQTDFEQLWLSQGCTIQRARLVKKF
jgi:tRNA (guanine-N7-)-methyltransferase